MQSQRLFGCDPAKRAWLLKTRSLDLIEAAEVFMDPRRVEVIDGRRDYGETRRITIGKALGIVVTLVYTERQGTTWLITAWPANRKERARYEQG